MSRFFNFDQPEPLNLQRPAKSTLQELLRKIQGLVEGAGATYWVVAEIIDLRTPASGHLYMECVQRQGETLLAKCRATCWRSTTERLLPAFERATGVKLKAGMEVLLRVNVSFHAVYGFSLTIQEIDARHTLGEMARRRQAIIHRLEEEGHLERNARLPLALVPRRLAVISSRSAAGFEDFLEHLQAAATTYSIEVDLYNATMQGDAAEPSVLQQLRRVARQHEKYDALILVRGGGATTDLSCFDSYPLAAALAQFPLPLITGIGHERDTSIVDLVAHTSLKTPTAVAGFISERVQAFVDRLKRAQDTLFVSSRSLLKESKRIMRLTTAALYSRVQLQLQNQRHILKQYALHMAAAPRQMCQSERERLAHLSKDTKRSSTRCIDRARDIVRHKQERIISQAPRQVRAQAEKLSLYTALLRASDPKRLLQRGYTLNYCDGVLVKELEHIQQGATLTTVARGGTILSVVEKVITTTEMEN